MTLYHILMVYPDDGQSPKDKVQKTILFRNVNAVPLFKRLRVFDKEANGGHRHIAASY
jgi:hypothetical protein